MGRSQNFRIGKGDWNAKLITPPASSKIEGAFFTVPSSILEEGLVVE